MSNKNQIGKIDFTYENSISLIKDIESKIKAIEIKFAWLFGYFVAVVIALAPYIEEIITIDSFSIFNKNAIALIGIIISISCLFMIIANRLIVSRFSDSPHNEIRKILGKANLKNDIEIIKTEAIKILQKTIEENEKKLKKIATDFNFCFCYVILSSPIVFAFITNYNA